MSLLSAAFGLEILLDSLREHLAELNAPLVETVDVPDHALGEDHMLIVGNQGTKSTGCDLLCEDSSGRSVAKEGLVRDEIIWSAFRFDLVRSLANHESFSLGEEIGCQHPLVLVSFHWVMRLGGHDEVGRDEFGALVKKLEEGVLSVGCRLAEEDGSSGVLDIVARASHSLAVRLHSELLQVSREAVHVLIEWCN